MKKEKIKKLRIGNVIKTIILLILFIDLLFMFYNMIIGNMLTWWGIITLVVNILISTLLFENLKKYYK